ncbi:hypothetical protein C8R46DRAFT_1113325 [Mycena filopes]|nr:hypothetical protein C8R46DRAFT_1113325 [Mycena filopes]
MPTLLPTTPMSRSSLDVFDDNHDRESLSSSELDSNDEYSPIARSVASFIAEVAKEKLAVVSPRGRTCLVTNDTKPSVAIEAAHLVSRSTKEELASRFGFCAGSCLTLILIQGRSINGPVRVDQHRSFDHAGFIFLPTTDVLSTMAQYMAAPNGRTYKQVFTRQVFEYRIIPLQLSQDGNGVFRRKVPDVGAVYDQIFPMTDFSAIPTISSHCNLFFIVVNGGRKLEQFSDLVPSPLQANPEVSGDIARVLALWTRWSHCRPTKAWKLNKYWRGGRSGAQGDGRGDRGEGQGSGRGDNDGVSRRRDGPPAPARQGHTNACETGIGQSGQGAGRPAGVPELDRDAHSDGAASEALTEEAVRSVQHMDRTMFLQKWRGDTYVSPSDRP